MHAFLGFDGISPHKFLGRARKQLQKYTTVTYVKNTISGITREDALYVVRDNEGRVWKSKAVLLATGLVDHLPNVPNIENYYGNSVHLCPYCDGWENRDKVLGVIGANEAAIQLAQELCLWSHEVILFTNEATQDNNLPQLPSPSGIRLITGKIEGLQSADGVANQLKAVSLENGEWIACHALFFSPNQVQHSCLAQSVGCLLDGSSVGCDTEGGTYLPGFFVAGNATKGIQMAIVAAAEGLITAAAINEWLMDLDS